MQIFFWRKIWISKTKEKTVPMLAVQEKDSNGYEHTRSITNAQVSGSAAKAKSMKSVAPNSLRTQFAN